MKNLFGLLLCAIGGYMIQIGYSMLKPKTQEEYFKRMRKAFLEI